MSSFSDANFAKKLNELNNTQQSIQTLSLWLIHHRKHSKVIVHVWHRELQKGKTQICFSGREKLVIFVSFAIALVYRRYKIIIIIIIINCSCI